MATVNDFPADTTYDPFGDEVPVSDSTTLPASQSTTAAVDKWETPNYVPPGNFSIYDADASAEANRQETAGLEAANSSFAPPIATLPEVVVTGERIEDPVYRVDVSGYEKPQQPLVNPLHDYDSYTYNLSLHAITTEQFNNLADNPNGYQPANVLIAGAGKYSDSFRRNAYFQEDFYFDNLNLRTVINTTKVNRFTNVIKIDFQIIEPSGFTLIQRLLSACEAPVSQGGVGGQNYLKQPFILQIDFYGSINNEIGLGIIPNQTKLIPIRLTKMTAKMSTRGTVYTISAAPFNHIAFDPTKIVTPATFSVKAAKVSDVLDSGEITAESTQETQIYLDQLEARNGVAQQNALNQNSVPQNQPPIGGIQPVIQDLPKVTQTLGTNGLATAYNTFYKVNEQKYQTKHDRIKFALDSDISNSLLYEKGQADVSSAASTASAKTTAQQSGGSDRGSIAFNAGTLTIPAGTNIQSVIEWAITNSEYMRKQIFGIKEANTQNDSRYQSELPLQLVKVVPRVRVLDYDTQRDNYRYEITYNIKKFYTNSRSPHAPQGRVKGWVKEYNYIYTGGISPYSGDNTSNRDVLDLSIDFNTLFYTTITAFKEKSKTFQTGKTQVDSGDSRELMNIESSGFAGDPGNVPATQDQNNVKPYEDKIARAEVYYNAGNKRTQIKNGGSQAASQAAADILNNQLLEATGDMLNVRLKITGDPHFIKQDDILYNQNVVAASGMLTPNNSLYTDTGELYVFLTFRSPIDYDETTGLAIPQNNPYSYSLFTGVYKILQVDSSFSGGQFIQELQLARLAISDENRLKENQTFFRREYGFEIGSGQNIRFPGGQNVGQRIIGTFFSGGLLNGAGGLEQFASSMVQKVFNEKVQPVIIQEIGRLTDSIFGGIGDFFGFGGGPTDVDFSVVGSFSTDVADYVDVGLDAFGDGNFTDVVDLEFFDFDFNASVPDALPDVEFLGVW